eukprot:6186559-Pleurochrysis_carterae.AAC.14
MCRAPRSSRRRSSSSGSLFARCAHAATPLGPCAAPRLSAPPFAASNTNESSPRDHHTSAFSRQETAQKVDFNLFFFICVLPATALVMERYRNPTPSHYVRTKSNRYF